MKNTAFFAILIVLILGIVYVLKTSDNPPETSMTQTPKDYIEFVEQKKAAKRATEAFQNATQETAE
jgi:uncharacterized MAPEG superfamily protein